MSLSLRLSGRNVRARWNDTFKATPQTLKISKDNTFNDKKVTSADIKIDDNGNFILHINNDEYIGSLSRERSSRAYYMENDARGQEDFNKKGYLDGGQSFEIKYYNTTGYDDAHNCYVRIVLSFPPKPYVHGKAVPPTDIYMDRVQK